MELTTEKPDDLMGSMVGAPPLNFSMGSRVVDLQELERLKHQQARMEIQVDLAGNIHGQEVGITLLTGPDLPLGTQLQLLERELQRTLDCPADADGYIVMGPDSLVRKDELVRALHQKMNELRIELGKAAL